VHTLLQRNPPSGVMVVEMGIRISAHVLLSKMRSMFFSNVRLVCVQKNIFAYFSLFQSFSVEAPCIMHALPTLEMFGLLIQPGLIQPGPLETVVDSTFNQEMIEITMKQLGGWYI